MADDIRPDEFKEGMWPRWTERVRTVEDVALYAYLEAVVEEAKTDYTSMFGVLSQRCESPIEALFLAAFLPNCLRNPSYEIRPQQPIGSYRVDFLVSYLPSPHYSREVIVECDGHDYHERTRDQAERDKKRDRAITNLGLSVFRFTGRELHRAPHACVKEIIDYIQRPL